MRSLLSGLLVAVVLAIVSAPSLAEELRLLSSWDTSYAPVPRVLDPFIKRLQEKAGGDLSITRSGPETIPPFEQLDPVARGLFNMLFTNGAYHYNQTAVGMTLDALRASPAELHKSGIWDYVDKQYQQMGLKLIAVLYDLNGYNIILREPLDDTALKGKRIRGTPIYHPLIEKLGGSPVVLPGSEIYPALERGVIDGAAWPTVGAAGFRWYEVADYMMRPSFGQVTHLVLMNLDRWNALDEKKKALIARVAEEFESEAVELFNKLAAEEAKTLADKGMEITELSDKYSSGIGQSWYEGAMNLAAKRSPEAVKQIRQKAENAGLVHAK